MDQIFFFRFFNKTVIFHSFVAKIGPLPTGLGLKKGAISNLKKIFNCSNTDGAIVSLTLKDDLNKIDEFVIKSFIYSKLNFVFALWFFWLMFTLSVIIFIRFILSIDKTSGIS
jgi:hypothetical protein